MDTLKFLQTLWHNKKDNHFILIWEKGQSKISHWVEDVEQAAAIVREKKDAADVYVGCGTSPQRYTNYQRCRKEDIAGIGGIWLDVDILDPVHKKKNLPASKEEADKMLEFFGLKPTISVNSGHGYQYWWVLDQYWSFTSPKEREEGANLTFAFLRTLKEYCKTLGYDLDSTFDLARVMRIPGSINHRGKEQSPVTLLDITTDFYPREILLQRIKECASHLKVEKKTIKQEAESTVSLPKPVQGADFILDPEREPPFIKFNALIEAEPRFKLSWNMKRKDFSDQSASSYDFSLANFALNAGWSWQETVDLIVSFRKRHNLDLKLRIDYYDRTLRKVSETIKKEQAIETIEDTVMGIGGADKLSHAERTEIYRNKISDLLGVPIKRIVKLKVDPPEYRLETPINKIHLGGVKNLIGQANLREKIADVTGRLIAPVKKEKWIHMAQALLDACEHEEVGEDSTNVGMVRNWINAYLSYHTPVYDANDGQVSKRPFYKGNFLYIFGPELRQFIARVCREQINGKNMGIMLKEYGFQGVTMNFKVKEKYISRSVWRITIEDPVAAQFLDIHELTEANRLYAEQICD